MVNVGKREDSMLDLIFDLQERANQAIKLLDLAALQDPTFEPIADAIRDVLKKDT